MRGKVLYLKPSEIVARARSKVGAPILYHLEYPNGGTDPDAPGPEAKEGPVADCVGFASWAGGFDRYCPVAWPDHSNFPLYDGYINTDSMVDNALGSVSPRWFRTSLCPAPGMFIVAPSFNRLLRGRVIGHIGVITEVGLNIDDPGNIKVVHCSPGNYQYTNSKSAIEETGAQPWFGYPKHYYVYLALPRPVSAIMKT